MEFPAPQSAFRDIFPPTVWSMVRLAVAEGQPGADRALNELCRLYQKPILIYILRCGHAPDAAEELKQAFFEELLEIGRSMASSGELFFIKDIVNICFDFLTCSWKHEIKRFFLLGH